ncbi:adenosylmethionine-8-amino-7-oxononanoate aminotransferase [Salinimicrobium catena]|uniref:Adenosylmethionine-8-amino-7-oxononanoate aminotransferase n=1 Tax=Salinimicrobium catena TaxID=390640 RepID=A0A1H5JE64_9FLAO|nr:adenosylmethionine--8-amino-7-oxononanoate transaminase [Salinimicrobium catena]SDK86951.1 adenosylmethionine-8-amino-7-oxononanoate aminotransferase [Salinimicrobium catena]SEE50744.1 adenosylmethionine-8-amino-7-oxononanoate aminotransferase [Salinimicrobium catena]
MKKENLSLAQRDQKHLWHPLTQHKTSGKMLPIVKAMGASLFDDKGKEYIDGIASWYTAVYGHCNKKITQRVAAQMQQLDQVVFSGFTHAPAIELSEALINILPNNQQKLFFSDNGSTATEIGIKMALQYHHNQGNDRKVMLAFEEGFHGDTFGAMSVSGLSVYNGAFEEHFIEVVRLAVPMGNNNREVLEQLRDLISKYNIAGFIYEPLVQGAAGMKMHDAEGLNTILKVCKQNNIITIADEVMTGFGKTGKNFASEYLETSPDIICMSKALTAGLLPMAITSCTQAIFDAFYSEDISKGLFHGHTYTANPLACTAALAGLELLTSKEIQQDIKRVMESHQQFGQRIKDHSKVKNLRQLGVIIAFELDVEMERYGDLRNQLFAHFMENGVFLRPLGSTIYISAPYIISKVELEKIYSAIEAALEKF